MQATQGKSNYNPHAVRRCVRVQAQTPQITVFVSKSMTQADDADRYQPTIEANGSCRCNCNHFKFRLKFGNVFDANTQCKHLQRAVATLQRRGEMPVVVESSSVESSSVESTSVDWSNIDD